MDRLIKKSKNPKFLVVTPLKRGDNLSSETIRSVSNSKVEFDWISYEGDGNIPSNTVSGIAEYEKGNKPLPYVIKIDNGTIWRKNTLKYMYDTIHKSKKNVAYVYVSFEFIKNYTPFMSFMDIPFNVDRLRQSNYISSNSMIKRVLLDKCPFIVDEKYKRLLDYAHWLSFLKQGYVGKLSNKGYFYSIMNDGNISSGSNEDYVTKLRRVHRDFL